MLIHCCSISSKSRDVKFGIQKIESDWPQMGQILDFLSSVSLHFGSSSQNVLKLILKSSRFVPFGGQSDPTWDQPGHECFSLGDKAGDLIRIDKIQHLWQCRQSHIELSPQLTSDIWTSSQNRTRHYWSKASLLWEEVQLKEEKMR